MQPSPPSFTPLDLFAPEPEEKPTRSEGEPFVASVPSTARDKAARLPSPTINSPAIDHRDKPPTHHINEHQLLEGLNDQQRQAVTAPNHHLLVLAGAGSGKTRVLIHRLAWLVSQQHIRPHQVMAVTFTNKAAREMNARLQGLSMIRMYSQWLGTFHGLSHRFLRTHALEANLNPNFTVMDSSDQKSVLRQVLEQLQINNDELTPKELAIFINGYKEKGLRANAARAEDSLEEQKIAIFRTYDEYCQKEGLLDFAELLLRTYEVLQRNAQLREHYQERFRHLLIDEFQDTNALQYDLLKLFCGPHTSMFAVGDDDQSIYAFRGAKVENLRHYEKTYAQGRVIRLEQSYRSNRNILEAANHLIAKNTSRLGKTLWTEQPDGEAITVYAAYNDEEEAKWVIGEIKKLRDAGCEWSDIAILYRINAHSRAYEHAAMMAGIPYKIYGGFRFYDREEIRHVLGYLRLMVNPTDETSLARVVNFPPRGIGDRSLELLRAAANAHGVAMLEAVPYLEGRSASVLASFVNIIRTMRDDAAGRALPDIMTRVIAQSGLKHHYEQQRDGRERLENLEELINAAHQYLQQKTDQLLADADERDAMAQRGEAMPDEVLPVKPLIGGVDDIAQFLSDAVLDNAEAEGSNTPTISLMSVHSAKGLEFESVFIGGLEHGIFPHENNLDIEEERRLMYVAITRAKKRLHISYAHRRMHFGKIKQNIPSLFLQEMPKTLLAFSGHLNPYAHPIQRAHQASYQPNSQRNHWADEHMNQEPQEMGEFPSNRTPRAFINPTHGVVGSTTAGAYSASTAMPEPMKTKSGVSIRLGQTVRHTRFGEGVVQKFEGKGSDAKVLISFGALGQKWLMLSLASLDVVD